MAIVVIPHVIQITARGKIGGRPWASVWHMSNSPAWFDAGEPVEELVRDFANNWQDHMLAGLTNAITVEAFDYLSLHSADGSTGTLLPDPAKRTAGPNTTGSIPPNTAALVKKISGSGRRSRSGRCYLPGLPEAAVENNGMLTASFRTGLQTDLNAFWNGTNDSGVTTPERQLVIAQRPPAAREPGTQIVQGTYSPVTSLVADTLTATQQRRLRG